MVLVCFDPEFVYIKTQKTAGTSTEMVLEKFCGPPRRKIRERTRGHVSKYGIIGRRLQAKAVKSETETPVWRPHMSASAVRRLVMPEFWERAEIVANLRNPFARNLSWFSWLRKMKKQPDFPDFDSHREAFLAWVKAANDLGETERLFVDGKASPTQIIRFEHLADDLAAVCKRLGLKGAAALPETKMSSKPEGAPTVADYYDAEAIDRVRRQSEWVLEAGGYDDRPPGR